MDSRAKVHHPAIMRSRIRNFMREWRDVHTLLSIPRGKRPIVVYSEDVSSYSQFEGYLNRLMQGYGRLIAYVTSDPDDPILTDHHPRMSVYYAQRIVPTLIPRIDSALFITTMPELGKLHIQRPKRESCCLYLFHSLNSIHEVYRQGAFDHYDAFFCAGPHHKAELEAHFKLYGLPMPALYEVGYYKLDRMGQTHETYSKKYPDKKTILVAPSWGKQNLLESYGCEIVSWLLETGARVVVRPHPCFFLPIYPGGRRIIDAIERRFESSANVEIERSIVSEDSFHEADLMVSDFSGAAYEYALGTLRPVLFVDVPRKTLNPAWAKLGLPTFEDTMRNEVGRVLDPSELPQIGRYATEMLERSAVHSQRLGELRETVIYNFGGSAEVGARIIDDMLN